MVTYVRPAICLPFDEYLLSIRGSTYQHLYENGYLTAMERRFDGPSMKAVIC